MPPEKTCTCGTCLKCKRRELVNSYRRRRRLGGHVNRVGEKFTYSWHKSENPEEYVTKKFRELCEERNGLR